MNHAPRKPVTATHTRRRRRSLTWLGSGPTVANPAEAAAFDVPTAGVPTYLVASPPPAADVFGVSRFGFRACHSLPPGPGTHHAKNAPQTSLHSSGGGAPPQKPS